MRTTILPMAIILNKAHRAAVSMMAQWCIVALVLPLRCFLCLLTNFTNILVFLCLFAPFSEEPEVFLSKYSQLQPAVLHAAHFRRLVKPLYSIHIRLRRVLSCWFLVGLLCTKFQGNGYDSDTYLVRLNPKKITKVLHFSKYKSK